MAFLKVLEDGSHMIMMECPDAVNTLLHEFFLWEPTTPPPPKKESRTRPETAKAQTDNTKATSEPAQVRPETARHTSTNGGAEEEPDSKAKKWLKMKTYSGCYTRWWLAMHFVMSQFIWNGTAQAWGWTQCREFKFDSSSVSCTAVRQRGKGAPMSQRWSISQLTAPCPYAGMVWLCLEEQQMMEKGIYSHEGEGENYLLVKLPSHLPHRQVHFWKDNTRMSGLTSAIPEMWKIKAQQLLLVDC